MRLESILVMLACMNSASIVICARLAVCACCLILFSVSESPKETFFVFVGPCMRTCGMVWFRIDFYGYALIRIAIRGGLPPGRLCITWYNMRLESIRRILRMRIRCASILAKCQCLIVYQKKQGNAPASDQAKYGFDRWSIVRNHC